jgi:hypothetical protein
MEIFVLFLGSLERTIVFSFKEFLFVAKVAFVLKKIYSQIWLWTCYEVLNFNHPSITLAAQSKTIYRKLMVLAIFSFTFGDWKLPKSLHFQVLISMFGKILPIKKNLARNYLTYEMFLTLLILISPFATLQWKVLLHAARNTAPFHWPCFKTLGDHSILCVLVVILAAWWKEILRVDKFGWQTQ